MSDSAEYRFASFWWRALAFIIDGFVLTFALAIIGGIIGLFGTTPDGYQQANAQGFGHHHVHNGGAVLGIVFQWLYFALSESSSWRATPGKRVCRLIVVDEDGRRIGFGRATGRYFGKFLSSLIFGLGFLMIFWTRRKQGLHDLMAGTLVLRCVPADMVVSVPKVQG